MNRVKILMFPLHFRLIPVMVIMILAIAGCGDQAKTDKGSQDAPAIPCTLLTKDEFSQLFLGNAQVWKYESSPGVPVHSVGLVFVEDGNEASSMASTSPSNRLLTKVIVIVNNEDDNKHNIRFLVEQNDPSQNSHSSSVDRGDAWFSKPLTSSISTVQTAVEAVPMGTTVLIGGGTGSPADPKTWIQQTAPCRLELRIK